VDGRITRAARATRHDSAAPRYGSLLLGCSVVLGGSEDVDGRDEEEGSNRACDQDFASHRTPRTQSGVAAVH
jgi:hypothetical protein